MNEDYNAAQRACRKSMKDRGYRGFMLNLTPSASQALHQLRSHYNEMNSTDIVCALLRNEAKNIQHGDGTL